MALPLYALTLFVSAFILFLVQPIIGKIILPKLGGTPQVWNTCMMFFQMVLLAGYAYTHNATSRLTLRQQLVAHAVLLLLPLVVLLPFPFSLGGEFVPGSSGAITGVSDTTPIVVTAPGHKLESEMRVRISGVEATKKDGTREASPQVNGTWTVTKIDNDKFSLEESSGSGAYVSGSGSFVGGTPNPQSLWGFVPDLGSNPIPSTLAILFLYVALPFLVVATSAPLLQKWFVHTGHPAAKDPYFLYGASNFGSMLSLIVYPILVEPWARLHEQGWLFTIGYLALIVFVVVCAATVWNSKEVKHKAPEPKPEPPPEPPPAPATTAEAHTGITATAPAAGAVKSGPPGKTHGKGPPPKMDQHPVGVGAGDDITFGRRFRWVMLAAIPSSLMLGITTHITTDLSPIPLFWLVPLILYLLSFILVFARWPVVWTETPHTVCLYLQPFFVFLMIMADVFNMASSPAFIGYAIVFHVLGFFFTTMVCHGELAKDRPSTKHLTEFYLLMSVGGMLGGVFNGLFAPILFKKLWELPLAIFAAGFVRPKMSETGPLDNFFAGIFEGSGSADAAPGKGGKHRPIAAAASGTASESLVTTLDFAWPAVGVVVAVIAYFVSTTEWGMGLRRNSETGNSLFMLLIFGVPLLIACAGLTRPVRLGLGFGVVLLGFSIYSIAGDDSKHWSRSYFGIISVREARLRERDGLAYRQLMHGHIDHGMNFIQPDGKLRGNPAKDLSRLATTYYHREGPVGRVMEKFNWFPDKPNSNMYSADAHMPASLVGHFAADFAAGGAMPGTTFVAAWSEPPIATVGLGTGTMASYGRPYQHVHFYEIDNQILRLSLHTRTSEIRDAAQYKQIRAESRTETWFTYLEAAIDRGSSVQVLMGDARLRMALPYKNHYRTDQGKDLDVTDPGGGPEGFYHMMVVDAFSSDAIPAHLLTEEAFKVYFSRLSEKGVLCVHTSNRFVDLPNVVAAISAKLKLAHKRGHDNNTDRKEGHYTSEWVMVARKAEYILKDDDSEFLDRYKTDWDARAAGKNLRWEPFWSSVSVNDRYRWTDDYYNLLSVIRWR